MKADMVYGAFHFGDWMQWTRFYSMAEKGVLMVLSKEQPLDPSLFDRITNRYTDEERKAFEFVISDFFVLEEDGKYHNSSLDEMIEKSREKSQKARKSIQARWSRKQSEERTNNERNTDELLTINNELLTKNTTTSSASEKKRSPLLPIPLDPDPEWVTAARDIRPDVDPMFVWRKMKDYYRAEKKAMATWRRIMMTWVGREHGQVRQQAQTRKSDLIVEVNPDDYTDYDPYSAYANGQ